MTKTEIIASIERELGHEVTEDMPINRLDCDSLEFVNLLFVLGEETGTTIGEANLSELRTVGDIVAEIEKLAA